MYDKKGVAIPESEKNRVIEEIYQSYLKHGGNALAVSKEFSLPYSYIDKLCDKFRKNNDLEVNRLVARSIVTFIKQGYESRSALYYDIIKDLEMFKYTIRSTCHKVPVSDRGGEYEERDRYTCTRCGEPCFWEKKLNLEVVAKKLEAIAALRAEDEALINFATKMGYSDKDELPPAPNYKQNILVVGGSTGKSGQGSSGPPELTSEEQRALRMVSELSPIEQEELRQDLSKTIQELNQKLIEVEAQAVEDQKEGDSGGKK